MTINTTTNRAEFAGDDVSTVFAFPYYFLAEADLIVLETVISTGVQSVKSLTTHYTVSGEGNPAGGSVTMLTAPASTVTLTIYRDPSAIQDVDLVEGDPLPVETAIEQPLDKLTMIVQRVKEVIERSLRLPEGDVGFVAADMFLPAEVDRASKYLGFDADGKPVATAGTTSDLIATPFVETLLDDATAGAFLTTLGISAYIQTLLNDADAATARATLGTGELVATGFTTGDVKLTLKTAADTGWVLMDDKTIGNAASGGTGRANADTEDLFTLLWTNTADADCAVSSGRGASAAADYAANKTIALPKTLGRSLACYGAGSGLTSRALAKIVGEETHVLTTTEMPAHSHTLTDSYVKNSPGGAGAAAGADRATGASTAASGSDGAHNNMQPTVFLNVMVKL
jgi:hypothetical protein